jgi:hypothetical protein
MAPNIYMHIWLVEFMLICRKPIFPYLLQIVFHHLIIFCHTKPFVHPPNFKLGNWDEEILDQFQSLDAQNCP